MNKVSGSTTVKCFFFFSFLLLFFFPFFFLVAHLVRNLLTRLGLSSNPGTWEFLGKRHNRVHPGHFATQQGTPFYPAGMSAADWSTLVFTLPRRKIAWVHPTKATFFQNCTLISDKYPVVSENETLPPAISPAEITLRSRQRAPRYTSSRAKHTVRNRHEGPASSSSA